MSNKAYRREKVSSVELLGVEKEGNAIYDVVLEGGLAYNWSEGFMRDHRIGGLKAGDVIGIRGKEGNENRQLFGSNVRDVKMIARASVPFLVTEVAECVEAKRPNGSRYHMMTFWEGNSCCRGMIFEQREFEEKGLKGIKVGDRLLFSADIKGWDRRRKLKLKDLSGLPYREIRISRVGPGL